MNKRNLICLVASILLVIIVVTYFLFFSSISSSKDTVSVNVYPSDNIDSVYTKIDRAAHPTQLIGYKILATLSGYKNRIRSGHYEIEPSLSSFTLLRKMRNGMQTPIKLTIPSVRTTERLAAELSKKVMLDSTSLLNLFKDSIQCSQLGCDTATIICLFIPNTYEVYWDTPIEQFMKRMKKESDDFWTVERTQKAQEIGLTPFQVMTLASIVDEETANNAEKPDIAGMYLNRLHQGMPLQADPTIKFATKQFQLRRIYQNMLFVKSPYNTYRNIGLPPGPIRVASLAGIEAVLNYTHHDYMYMCAKEDFSGTHRFAKTYSEHLANAKRYTEALNNRGIQ